MGAFDILFRGRRQVPIYRRRSSIGSLVGLAGIGYMAYRYLQSERGRALQSDVVGSMKSFGERIKNTHWHSASPETNA